MTVSFPSARWRGFHSTSTNHKKGRTRREREPVILKSKSKRKSVETYVGITIADLAKAMEADVDDVFASIWETKFGEEFEDPEQTINDVELLTRIVQRMGFNLSLIAKPTEKLKKIAAATKDNDVIRRAPPRLEDCVPRAPVVTIMGHVDHGKTTLLDALRHSQIVDSEFGGITQHIGAFKVSLPAKGASITFLDTPGHAAFHTMRQRGASVTDIVVLVVAADDGVMEQTKESIRFAREAAVPMVVAINKCDRHQADIEMTKRTLMESNVVLEDFGGDIQAVPISALKKTNLEALQEAILTQADVLNLKADPKGLVEGVVIESKTVHGKGKVCTALVQRGTLTKNRVLVASQGWCKVRTLTDEHGQQLKEVSPGEPVEISGWREELPNAGDEVLEVESQMRAEQVISSRRQKAMEEKVEADAVVIADKRELDRLEYLENRDERLAAGYLRKMRRKDYVKKKEAIELFDPSVPRFCMVVRGDVAGSVEAIVDVLATYDTSSQCHLDILDFGVGSPSPSDLDLAESFKGEIYTFTVPVPSDVEAAAAARGVPIRSFNVIYHLIADLKARMTALLPPISVDQILGEGVVLKEFLISKKIPTAGCRVSKGTFDKANHFRFSRNGIVYYDGEIESLRKEKDVASFVPSGETGGIQVEDRSIRFEPGDKVECYITKQVPAVLKWHPPGF